VQVLQLCPKIPIDKGKYRCRYCNKTPKFQLVELSISLGIASLNEKINLNAIPTFKKNPSRWFGYPQMKT
jgi:hypothetical protein